MKNLSVLFCLFMLALALPALAAQPKVPAESLTIKGSKKEVSFSHVPSHEKVECVICHHKVDGKEDFRKCATAGCHDNLTEKKGEKSLYAVMHTKSGLKHQTCTECHFKVIAEKPDLKKDLTACAKSKCHP